MTESVDADSKLRAQQSRNIKRTIITIVLVAIVLVGGIVLAVFLSPKPTASIEVENRPPQAAEKPSVPREALQAPLSELKQRIVKLKTNTAKFNWDVDISQQFEVNIDQLFLSYGSGENDKVAQGIDNLNDELDNYDQGYESAYMEQHRLAQQSFDEGQIQGATLANNQTLDIIPDYEPALKLKDRLAVFSVIKALQRDIAKANIENNIDEEFRLLRKLVSLDPLRVKEHTRLAEVAKAIQNRDFAQAIKDAYDALDKGEIQQAKRAWGKGRKIDNTRAELGLLSQEIKQLEDQLALARFQSEAKTYGASDNWNAVLQLTKEGLSSFPNDNELQKIQTLATDIVNAQSMLQIHIDRPDRLFDNNIRNVAAQELQEVSALKNQSATLDNMVSRIESTLQLANQPIPVWFESDNKTFIQVLRVGQVGETKGREVNLLPGRYRIEGRRDGYKTKLISINVLPDQDNRITIICDEQI